MAQTSGFTIWFTGMLGAGKTTLAEYIAARLRQVGRRVEVLDEDELSDLFWKELTDSKEDRATVIRRIGVIAHLLSRNEVCVLVAASSPYKAVREENRRLIGKYLEVFIDCPTDRLIQRDTTGKYKKALAGEIPNFVGITEPYEPPTSPEVMIRSDSESVDDGGLRVLQAPLDLGQVTPDELKVITGMRMKKSKLGKKKFATPAKAHGRSAPKPAKKKKKS